MSMRSFTERLVRAVTCSITRPLTQRKNNRGWSQIETLTTLTIIAILSGLSLPNLNQWYQQKSQSSVLRSLYHLAYFGRSQAITTRSYVTVCPTTNQFECSHNWNDSIVMVFSDHNRNEMRDSPEDQLHRIFYLPDNKPCFELRASSQKKFLQFKSTGASNGVAGHFRFCDDVHNRVTKKLVMSLNGRPSIQDL